MIMTMILVIDKQVGQDDPPEKYIYLCIEDILEISKNKRQRHLCTTKQDQDWVDFWNSQETVPLIKNLKD